MTNAQHRFTIVNGVSDNNMSSHAAVAMTTHTHQRVIPSCFDRLALKASIARPLAKQRPIWRDYVPVRAVLGASHHRELPQ